MKRILTLILALAVGVSICSCGTGQNAKNRLHNTVETDIIKLTLDNAELAIALDAHGVPKKYDPSVNTYNPYVAAKGHTLVSYSVTLENTDRKSITIDPSKPSLVTVKYKGKEYAEKTKFVARATSKFDWGTYLDTTVKLKESSMSMYSGYMDIPVDADNLEDDFDIVFSLPCSSGENEEFAFSVTAEDRENYVEPEVSLSVAFSNFDVDECKQVVAEHIDEYTPASGEEIKEFITAKTRQVVLKDEAQYRMNWRFENDGRIFELEYKTGNFDGAGYINNRMWKIEDNNLILTSNYQNNFKSHTYKAYQSR